MHFGDADRARQVAHLRFAIARQQDDFLSTVLGFEMRHEGGAFLARLIAKAERGGIGTIHKYDAFEPGIGWGQIADCGRCETAEPRDVR